MDSLEEIEQFFFSQPSCHSILLVGDSNARQLYGTLSAMLNASSPATNHSSHNLDNLDTWDMDATHIIDLNKHTITEVCTARNTSTCRHLTRFDNQPSNAKVVNDLNIDFLSATCPEHILAIDLDRLFQDYTLVLVHLGAWHLLTKCRARLADDGDFRQVLMKLNTFRLANLTIVWLTMGSFGNTADYLGKVRWKLSQRINLKLQEVLEQTRREEEHERYKAANTSTQPPRYSLTVLDWGLVMLPTSWPYQDRIHGDIAPHYGLEGRLVQVQMLINHLLDLLGRNYM